MNKRLRCDQTIASRRTRSERVFVCNIIIILEIGSTKIVEVKVKGVPKHLPVASIMDESPEDDFKHNIAIKLSRALNIINPNDLLAERFIAIAKSNDTPSFIKGKQVFNKDSFRMMLTKIIFKAARGISNFQESFLTEIHDEILAHDRQQSAGAGNTQIQGFTVYDADVLAPEPARKGGLVRADNVRFHVDSGILKLTRMIQQHTFRTPAKPLQPPTPRKSLLGLDTLAQEKRSAAQAALNEQSSRKRPRVDGDPPQFKGERTSAIIYRVILIISLVPGLPASRTSNFRQKPEDTPSRGPGLSDAARRKLEEHRRARDNNNRCKSLRHISILTYFW